MKLSEITSKLLAKIEQKFKTQGITLTQKRQHVLTTLIEAQKSISAYDIVDRYQKTFDQSIPAMSVYRILDYLIEIGAVHKLESVNQYIVCEHIACEHIHQKAQFLICDNCNSVQEIVLDQSIIKSLNESVSDVQFSLKSPQLELHGQCSNCSSN